MSDILAWHFTNGKLRNGDPIPPVGEVLRWDGPLVMCKSGLHASIRAVDALGYAPGATLHRVRCSGEMLPHNDKLVCRERTILWSLDATAVLRAFARRCALDVIHLWDAPAVVREFLETGREDLRAATGAAARDAARDAGAAACAAASAAAWDARVATGAAARDAARDAGAAASAAASAATSAAARDAARDAGVAASAAARDAASAASRDARAAAWDAARDAARAAQNVILEEMLTTAHEDEGGCGE